MDYFQNNSQVYSNRNFVKILDKTDLQKSFNFAVAKRHSNLVYNTEHLLMLF